jgi:predicted transcriptional regulator
MKTISVQLSDEVAQRLSEVSRREHRAPEQTASEILRRRLMLDRFSELCRDSQTMARAAGYESEEDVLKDVS